MICDCCKEEVADRNIRKIVLPDGTVIAQVCLFCLLADREVKVVYRWRRKDDWRFEHG
jgi:hypothetical protein